MRFLCTSKRVLWFRVLLDFDLGSKWTFGQLLKRLWLHIALHPRDTSITHMSAVCLVPRPRRMRVAQVLFEAYGSAVTCSLPGNSLTSSIFFVSFLDASETQDQSMFRSSCKFGTDWKELCEEESIGVCLYFNTCLYFKVAGNNSWIVFKNEVVVFVFVLHACLVSGCCNDLTEISLKQNALKV